MTTTSIIWCQNTQEVTIFTDTWLPQLNISTFYFQTSVSLAIANQTSKLCFKKTLPAKQHVITRNVYPAVIVSRFVVNRLSVDRECFWFFTMEASVWANRGTLFSCFQLLQNVTRWYINSGIPASTTQWNNSKCVCMPARTGVGQCCSGNQIKKFQSAARDKSLIVYSGIW